MSFTDEKSVNEKTSLIASPIRLVRWGSVTEVHEGGTASLAAFRWDEPSQRKEKGFQRDVSL